MNYFYKEFRSKTFFFCGGGGGGDGGGVNFFY